MATPAGRRVAFRHGDGHIRLVEQDVPPVEAGTVLVEVHASLVSPGSGVGTWRGFAGQRENPDRDARPRPIGYSNAGIVLETGEGVTAFCKGDRVACIGAGYALHTDYAVVPHNLAVALPDNVTFAQGSYAMLLGTALHALRRGAPEFGESCAVVGLGILGQLTAMFYRLAGNFVIGWDVIPRRLATAEGWGIDAVVNVATEDEVERTKAFTRNYGLDSAVIAFGGDANDAIQSVRKSLKVSPDGHMMGRIVIVGGAHFDWPFGAGSNADIRHAGRTGFGYHDEEWETGAPYPPVVMRWTTRTNLELCMRWIAEGRLDVDCLTTHTIPLADVEAGIDKLLDNPDDALGVVFEPK
jgi:threonine dehydrogenase-like Zn-dependent dehydrogenase